MYENSFLAFSNARVHSENATLQVLCHGGVQLANRRLSRRAEPRGQMHALPVRAATFSLPWLSLDSLCGALSVKDESTYASRGSHGVTADVAARKMKHINIAVRIRPLNNDELQAGERVGLHQNGSELQVSSYPQVWNFGRVFDSKAPTSAVFRDVVARMLNDAVDGKNVTIFAYGQTGSGKTYTMEGLMKESAEYLFQQIMGAQDREFLLKMSAVEVYNEAIHDLMQSNQQDTSHSRVELGDTKGGKTIMKGATEESLLSSSHLQRMLARVQINRKVHAYTRAAHK